MPIEGETGLADEQYLKLGSGKVVMNARGATRPISLSSVEVMFLRTTGGPAGGYASSGIGTSRVGGTGVGELPFLVDLPQQHWKRFQIDLGRLDLPKKTPGAPARLNIELYLRSPEEIFVVPVPLVLDGGGAAYGLDDVQERHRFLGRTIWRSRGIRDRLLRLTRFRL